MRKIYSLLFLIVGILIFSACGNNNSQETIVYASNLNFKVSEIVKEVGDEIIIDNNLINLQPWRSKILEVTTTNSEIAEYNQLNNTVTCLKDGEATIIVTALGENENLQSSVKLTVKPKIVYAQDFFSTTPK